MAIVNYIQFQVFTQPHPQQPGKSVVQVQTGPHGLFSGGLVMEMAIGIDDVTAQALPAGTPAPSPVIVKGLFDTGCTITSIDQSLVTKLGLKVRGFAQTATANGVTTASQHLVSLNFPGTQLRGRLVHTVQAINLAGQPFQVLVGRDLMAGWSITYNGPSGFVSIAD
jgi:hypothetical protein